MNILHISCSPRGPASESHRLSQHIIGCLRERAPAASVVERMVGGGALAHVDENYALALSAPAASPLEASGQGSLAQSDELIAELERADCVVIATPMHNLTVPSALKAWIDHIVRIRRTFNVTPQGKFGTLRDRPVYIAIASGGRFSGEHARQPDFLTPYLKFILGTLGLHDVTFFSVEGTAFGAEAVAEARTTTARALQAHFSAPGV